MKVCMKVCKNCHRPVVSEGQGEDAYWYHSDTQTTWCFTSPDDPLESRLLRAEPA